MEGGLWAAFLFAGQVEDPGEISRSSAESVSDNAVKPEENQPRKVTAEIKVPAPHPA